MVGSNIKHHLPQEVLMAYSAGSLPEAYGLVVATHVSICDRCRADLASFEAVGGAVLEEMDAVAEVSDALLKETLALLDTAAPSERVDRPKTYADATFPEPLAKYVGGGPDAVKWRKLGGGVKQAILPTSKDASARLLFIPAGAKVPDHGHKGLELTMVLQGAFADHVDRFGRGDVEVGHEDLDHQPIAEMGEDCICLAATDAPLVFNSMIPKMLQPFFNI